MTNLSISYSPVHRFLTPSPAAAAVEAAAAAARTDAAAIGLNAVADERPNSTE